MALFSARLLLLCQCPSSGLSLVSHFVYKYNPIINIVMHTIVGPGPYKQPF